MTSAAKRVALYLRVSTDGQTVANQEQALRETADRHGWSVVAVYKDAGISGKNGREKRPGFNALWAGITRREFDLVAVWAIDRLSRSLLHLIQITQEMKAKGVDLFVQVQGIDTTTPAGEMLLGIFGSLAQWERAMIRERTVAGIRRAKKSGKRLGRPPLPDKVKDEVRRRLAKGESKASIARTLKIDTKSVWAIATG